MARSVKKDVSLAATLLSEARAETTDEDIASTTEMFFEAIPGGKLIPIERVEPWERQPRKTFDEAGIAELALSIAASGVLEPLVVRRHPERPGHYLVVAGHRRLLAARRVHGSKDVEDRRRVAVIPCVIREATEDGAFADALIENLVRKDLTRREVMDAVVALKAEYGWSVREIGRRTGRDQKDLSKLIRIAEDEEVAALVADDVIAPTAAGPLVEARNRALRPPILAKIRAGLLRTGAEIERAIAAEREVRAPYPVLEEASAPADALTLRDDETAMEESGGSGDNRMHATNPAPSDSYGQVRDIPHLTVTKQQPDMDDDRAGRETISVAAHMRRIGASTRAEALARDIITFARQDGMLDRAAIGELERAQEELAAYLMRQKAALTRTQR